MIILREYSEASDKNIEIGIVGFGAIGQQLYYFLLEANYPKSCIHIFDDYVKDGYLNLNDYEDYKKDEFKNLLFIPAIGYKSVDAKINLIDGLTKLGYPIGTFVHPTAYVNEKAKLGRGVIIYPRVLIDQFVEIGDGVILNNGVIVSHNSIIGQYAYLSPGVVLSGFVEIGNCCFVGTSSSFSGLVKCGEGVTIGIGTCVTANIPDYSYVIGNPMLFKQKLNIK